MCATHSNRHDSDDRIVQFCDSCHRAYFAALSERLKREAPERELRQKRDAEDKQLQNFWITVFWVVILGGIVWFWVGMMRGC